MRVHTEELISEADAQLVGRTAYRHGVPFRYYVNAWWDLEDSPVKLVGSTTLVHGHPLSSAQASQLRSVELYIEKGQVRTAGTNNSRVARTIDFPALVHGAIERAKLA